MGIISLLFNPRRRKTAMALAKAARERGMTVAEFTSSLSREDLARYVAPDKKAPHVTVPDVTKFGLPPDADVTADTFVSDREIDEAERAFVSGDWKPAAQLLSEIGTGWDRRTILVRSLGEAVANDEAALDLWRDERPGDPDAAAVNAEGLVCLAWQVRSSLRAEHVSREQFQKFFAILESAKPAAQEAAALAPEDPTPWVTMLAVARGLQYENDAFREVWEQLVARDPHHLPAHNSALQYWCEKWFGSHELMWAFAEEGAAKHPKLARLPLVAAHEADYRGVKGAWRNPLVAPAVDRLLPWLDGEGRDDPGTVTSRAYAARALVELGRGEEAVEQFRHLGVHADALVWAYGNKGRIAEFKRVRYLACRLVQKA
ncbi:DUF4034 domain-containing protein [Amycolatopsis rhabdoformis]|uniref:DUF4034 domain-containing protein n=1 Tax=Amycolatopsis rhabdoformis TaxID=1448059 RepID=A0ABZ1I147_9PSEU|nr:DUF4034 domain-containing protein [Amycolatopsis rhabdoformis]WSE27849.1 DUF4034 domain-containing protein [Amycolatopsis rhabdoformis]